MARTGRLYTWTDHRTKKLPYITVIWLFVVLGFPRMRMEGHAWVPWHNFGVLLVKEQDGLDGAH